MNRYVLNTSVLTNYGTFCFEKIDLEQAKRFVEEKFTSAIGHDGTSKLLSNLLGKEIKTNRVQIAMDVGDEALVVRLKLRLEEGRILSYEEMMELYERGIIEFGILRRIA